MRHILIFFASLLVGTASHALERRFELTTDIFHSILIMAGSSQKTSAVLGSSVYLNDNYSLGIQAQNDREPENKLLLVLARATYLPSGQTGFSLGLGAGYARRRLENVNFGSFTDTGIATEAAAGYRWLVGKSGSLATEFAYTNYGMPSQYSFSGPSYASSVAPGDWDLRFRVMIGFGI